MRLDVADPGQALEIALEMGRRLGSSSAPALTLVESMVPGSGEWFVGARRDAAFGVVLTVGIGGGDVESRTPVLIVGTPSPQEISRRLGAASGQMGQALSQESREQLTRAAVKLIQLFAAVPALSEVDVNPLLETADGLVAVDAVMIASAGS